MVSIGNLGVNQSALVAKKLPVQSTTPTEEESGTVVPQNGTTVNPGLAAEDISTETWKAYAQKVDLNTIGNVTEETCDAPEIDVSDIPGYDVPPSPPNPEFPRRATMSFSGHDVNKGDFDYEVEFFWSPGDQKWEVLEVIDKKQSALSQADSADAGVITQQEDLGK